jgi:MATE family multidrug resistance protein
MQALAITDFFYFYKNKSDILIYSINYQFWTMMVAMGFSEAISVRVSNELGARRPKEAKFSVAVASLTSAMIGAIFMSIFFIWRTSLPSLFSDDKEVVDGAARLGYLLAVTVFFGNIGPVLSGI